jgi:WD40 repeat protein
MDIRHGTGEAVAGIGIALVLLASITPFLLQPELRVVNSVAYSPDGMRIAADVEGFVYLWDAETGELVFAVDSGPGVRVWNPGHDLTFSADGRRIAVSSYRSGAIIIDTETGERLVSIDDYVTSARVADIAFSPDGSRLLLTLADGNVGLYDAIDGRFLTGFKSTIQKDINLPDVNSVAFSPDGSKVAAGGNYWPRRGPSEGFAAIWDINSGQEHLVVTGHATPVQHVVFSMDNTRIMTVGYAEARIWDTRSGAALVIPQHDCSGIVDAAFIHDGSHIAIACEDGTVHHCDTTSGQCSVAFSQSSLAADGIVAIAFHPDGNQVATATLLGSISVWNMRTGKRVRKLKMPSPD